MAPGPGSKLSKLSCCAIVISYETMCNTVDVVCL